MGAGSSPLARGLPSLARNLRYRDGIIPARAGFTNWSVNGPVVWRDHPRSRGVYLKQIGRDVEKTGSSPLARGLLTRLIPFWEETRIIPARAGFTPIPWPTRWPLPDHPRSRGVYCARLVASRLAHGSSPLARGLLGVDVGCRTGGRIIRARAGFTSCATAIARRSEDHPRSRGVYSTSQDPSMSPGGSSPLARGLRAEYRSGHHRQWIIPARAGFTKWAKWIADLTRDHPRSRGVYHLPSPCRDGGGGSSPLARGLPPEGAQRGVEGRIIPARAGFTAGFSARTRNSGDHPRSRGVYGVETDREHGDIGSSPLARGLRGTGRRVSLASRIIPARAGFTCIYPPRPPNAPDHPRSRGVYLQIPTQAAERTGSSPLARGLRSDVLRSLARDRIIPARAGFTRSALFRSRVPGGSSPLARGLLMPWNTFATWMRIIPARAGFTLNP